MLFPLETFPFRLTQAQVVGGQSGAVAGFPGGLFLRGQKGDACGALMHPVLRRHNKVGDIPGKGFVSKDAAVSHQKHRFRQVCKFLLQLR